MVEWREYSFGDLVENLDSRRVPVKAMERKPGPYPYYGAQGITDYVDGYLFEGLHLLIPEDGENLRSRKQPIAILADGRFWVNNHAHVVRGNALSDTRFLSYLIEATDISGYVTGSAQPKLSQGSLNSIRVRVPEPPVQRAIAAVLGSLDDKIEVNRRAARVLEGIARTIFRSWFVDFDPVRRAAAGEPTGLPDDLAALFPTRLTDSPLGDIPEGWEVRPLPEVFEVNPTRSLRKGEMAPYLDMSNMPTEGHAPANWIGREVGSGMKFTNGDTLVARITPCLENGKTAFVDFLKDGEVAWGSTEYIVLRPRAPIPPVFAYLLARSDRFRSFAIQAMTGSSGRQRVPADSLAHFEIVVPPTGGERLFKMFGATVEPLFSRMQAAISQTRVLAATRDELLPQLVSGKLRVPNRLPIAGRAGV